MPADFFGSAHHFDQFIRQIFWMGRHKPDSLQSLDFFNLLKKLCKCHRMLQILSIGIDILSQKHNLHNSVCYETLNLTYDRFRVSAAFPSTHIWYNTVTAEIIAAEHDINTGFERILSLNRKVFNDLICIFPDINYHPVRLHAVRKKLCEFVYIMCAEDQVYKPVTLFQFLYNLRFLHHTAT